MTELYSPECGLSCRFPACISEVTALDALYTAQELTSNPPIYEELVARGLHDVCAYYRDQTALAQIADTA